MIQRVAINDVQGYSSKSKDFVKRKLYEIYRGMIVRCYSSRYQLIHPSYNGCSVCDKWLRLSGFLEDLPKIEGYDLLMKYLSTYPKRRTKDSIVLDKDSKVEGNKIYSVSTCKFMTLGESSAEMNKRNCKNGTGQFSHNAISKRVISTDFTNFRMEQMKFAMSYAKPVIVTRNGLSVTMESLHECARNLGVSKASIKYAIKKGIALKGVYLIHYLNEGCK